MRQAGFLAAAGIYALDHHVNRLADDHAHAKALANALVEADFVSSVMPVETNIVLFDVRQGLHADTIVKELEQKGILCNSTSPQTIRFVTHLDVLSSMIDQTIQTISNLHH